MRRGGLGGRPLLGGALGSVAGRPPRAVRTLVGSEDWSGQTPGAGTVGGSLLRATDRGVEKTNGTRWTDSVGGANIARIGSRASLTGLRIEGPLEGNELGSYAPNLATWSAFGSATKTLTTGPDGTNSAHRADVAAGAAVFTGTPLNLTSTARRTLSAWVKKTSTDPLVQVQYSQSGVSKAHAVTAPVEWTQTLLFDGTLSFNANTFVALPDGRGYTSLGQGGVAAQDQDVAICRMLQRKGPMCSYAPGAASGEVLRVTGETASLQGRAAIVLPGWAPDISRSDALSWGIDEYVIWWTHDVTAYVAIDVVRGQVRVVVLGERRLLPVQLPDWSTDDVFTFDLSPIGGGVPTGSFTHNGGASTSLGFADAALPPLYVESIACSWFAAGATSDASARHMAGVHKGRALYAVGRTTGPAFTYYASPTGTGVGSLADPASLADALALCAAHLPGATNSVRLVLRGGSYVLAATLDLDAATYSGLEIVAYPGEDPSIEGGTVVTGWADDGSGQGVSTATISHDTMNLWVNGVRAIHARSAEITSGWTRVSDGFTAPDSTIGSAAHPELARLRAISAWRMMDVAVEPVGTTGTSVKLRAAGLAKADSSPFYSMTAASLIYAYGLREYITGSTPRYFCRVPGSPTTTLSYKPGAGENLATDRVVAGRLQQLLRITGTAGNLARITIRGVTFAYTTTPRLVLADHATVQGAIEGTTGSGPLTNVGTKIGAAVQLRYFAGTITGCTLAHLAECGIALEVGTQGATLAGNRSTDLGGASVTIGDASSSADWQPSTAAERVSDNVLEDNTWAGQSVEFPGHPEVWYGYCSGLRIRRNSFPLNRTISAWHGGWGWRVIPASAGVLGDNIIENNKVAGTRMPVPGTAARLMADAGAGYHVGDAPGTIVRDNDISGAPEDFGAVYLDSGSGAEVSGNVLRGLANLAVHVAPDTANSSVIDNFWTANGLIDHDVDPSVTVTGNINNTTTDPDALEVIRVAGPN